MPSQKEIKEVFEYDESNGRLTWKRNAPPKAKKGDIVVSQITSLNGRQWTTSKIIWCFMTGDWPTNHVKFIDGDPTNTRFSNMKLKVD